MEKCSSLFGLFVIDEERNSILVTFTVGLFVTGKERSGAMVQGTVRYTALDLPQILD
jgi:hypothetical protein